MVNLYATFDIQIDSINTLSNKILDNMLSLIIIATNNVIVANTYDRILFVFLSLFVNIGKFTVSAGFKDSHYYKWSNYHSNNVAVWLWN